MYAKQQRDIAYFTVHHLQQRQGELSDGGRLVVLHENCAPDALGESFPEESRPHRMSRFVERRFGPTWLEVHMTGLEIDVSAMRFVHPSSYQSYHHTLLQQGSHRRAVIRNPWYQETLQKRMDESHFFFGDRQASTTQYTPTTHDQARTSPHLSVQRKERVHGNQVCVYESMYSTTLAGQYNLSVWLQNVNYEHAINLGIRGGWQRVQFALLWSEVVSLTAISDAQAWTRKAAFSSHTPTAVHSSVSAHVNETGNVTWQYTPLQDARPPVYGESTLLFLPVAENLTVPFLPHTRHYGRWVHVNATTERNGTLARPLSWDRAAALTRYTAPPLGLCRIASLAEYAFVPYQVDQEGSAVPPISRHAASLAVNAHASSALSSRSTRFSTASRPFSFGHASTCLSGRRLAIIGDSHSRLLISRFVSTFVGSDFKFRKQKFSQRPGETRPPVEWQCVTLKVDLTHNGSKSDPGVHDQSMAMAYFLPVVEEVDGNQTVALGEGEFELCHYPSSMLDPDEVSPAFFDQGRAFDVIVLDTAHHPLSYGITIPDYGEMLISRIGKLEALLTDGLLNQMADQGELNGTALSPHLTQNSTQRLATALWDVTSPLWNLSREDVTGLPFTEVFNATLLTDTVDAIARFPSLGLAELRRRSLWWSSQSFPRRNDFTGDPEKRTEVRLQMAREVMRAVTALLGLDYVDVVEPISLPFQDCASDRAHIDSPAVDEVFVQFYDALQQKLQCPQDSVSSSSPS